MFKIGRELIESNIQLYLNNGMEEEEEEQQEKTSSSYLISSTSSSNRSPSKYLYNERTRGRSMNEEEEEEESDVEDEQEDIVSGFKRDHSSTPLSMLQSSSNLHSTLLGQDDDVYGERRFHLFLIFYL